MARDFSRAFYKSSAWKRCQAAYMAATVETDRGPCPPYMCEECFRRGELTPAKIVHHRRWLSPDNITDSRVTLGWDNLERVCQECHNRIHFGLDDFVQRVTFGPDGRVVER